MHLVDRRGHGAVGEGLEEVSSDRLQTVDGQKVERAPAGRARHPWSPAFRVPLPRFRVVPEAERVRPEAVAVCEDRLRPEDDDDDEPVVDDDAPDVEPDPELVRLAV